MNVLFLIPYPLDEAPSQRFRFEQYFTALDFHNIHYKNASFFDLSTWKILYKPGYSSRKAYGFLKGYIKRVLLLFQLQPYQVVFIHREAAPLGPPWLEWWISKIAKKRIIYDFDDAIWINTPSAAHPSLRFLKFSKKVIAICKLSYKISCGNSFLADFARQYNDRVLINPTTVDTVRYHLPCPSSNEPLVVGWTGTHSTLIYLETILPQLKQVHAKINFTLKIICNQPPEFEFPGLQYVPWKKKDEIEELNSLDIGLMPLPDTPWTRGKCGFKILQYMALEKATLASAVGTNTSIINHRENGLLCYSEKDWITNLTMLLDKESLRINLGNQARKKVIETYSVDSNTENFLSLFKG